MGRGPSQSQAVSDILTRAESLPVAEKQRLIAELVAQLAAAVSKPATSEAGSRMKAVLSTSCKSGKRGSQTAVREHHFKEITAIDGGGAIELTVMGSESKLTRFVLPDGARGKYYKELPEYGKDKLSGASLLSKADFRILTGCLVEAIKGLPVVNGELQTGDKALLAAYRTVCGGVRCSDSWCSAVFERDEQGAITGSRVRENATYWRGYDFPHEGALFGWASEVE